MTFVLALDQGTSGTKAIVVDESGVVRSLAEVPLQPRYLLLVWTDRCRRFPVVRAVQDGRVLARKRVAWPAAPGRVFRVPADLVSTASATGGPVVLHLEGDAEGVDAP